MKVLVSDPIHKEGLEALKEFSEVEVATNLSNEELIKKVPGFDAMIVRSGTKVRKDVLDAAENLKLIVRAGVGLDNIDLDYAKKIGVKVENTPEASSNAVSELAIGLMIAWARSITEADRSLKNGDWLKSNLSGTELQNKTLGIIGTGRIGCKVAEKGKSFNMEILGYDIDQSEEFEKIGVQYVDILETLLEESDYVSLHVPINSSTEGLIGVEEFEIMKKSAVLINTARGGIIDEDALIEALKEGKISGACLDVYKGDPTENEELLNLENVILTPHIGASTEETQRSVGVMAAEKVKENLK